MTHQKITKEEVVRFLHEWKDACLKGDVEKMKTFFLRPQDGVLSENGEWHPLDKMCDLHKKVTNPQVKMCDDFCMHEISEAPSRVRLWAFSLWKGTCESKEMVCSVMNFMILERTKEGKLVFVILARPCMHHISDTCDDTDECKNPHHTH